MADFEELGLLDVAAARWIYRRAGLWSPSRVSGAYCGGVGTIR